MRGHVRHLHPPPCPPRCRDPASWQAVVYAGRDPITGRKRQKTATRPTKREAERAAAQLVERYSGHGHATADLTVAELCERWISEARLEATTRRRSRSIIDRSIVPHIGVVKLARLDGDQLDRLYRHLAKHGAKCNVCWSRIGQGLQPLRDGEAYATSAAAGERARCGAPTPQGPCRKWPRKHTDRCERHGGATTSRPLDRTHAGDCVQGLPMAPGTVLRVHTTLRSALRYAKRKRWLDHNPADDADPPSQRRPKIRPLAPADVARLLAEAQRRDFQWYCWLRLDAVTGARRGEVCALQWGEVDFGGAAVEMQYSIAPDTDEHGRPAVDGQGRRKLLRKQTKADTAKRVEVDPVTLALLAELQRRARREALAVGRRVGPSSYVFSPDPAGLLPWSPDTMTQRFRRLRARLGLEHAQLKDLRHFVASNMLRGGIDLVRAAARTGHDEQTFLKFYAHHIGGGREAADLLARLVDGPDAAAEKGYS